MARLNSSNPPVVGGSVALGGGGGTGGGSTDAGDLVSGTLDDARLSDNVPLRAADHSALAAVATAGQAGAVPLRYVGYSDADGRRGAWWELVSRGSLASTTDLVVGVVVPSDFNASTNNYVWVRVA